MNILVVSDREPKNSKTDFLVNSFNKLYNADVIYTKYNDEKLTLFDRVLNKLNIELDKSDINKRIFDQLTKKRYDVLFILKGNRIYPWTLKQIKNKYPNILLVSWSGDNMTKWHNKSYFYHFGVNNYDVIFSIDIPDYKNMEKFCKKPIYYLDKSACKYLHKPLFEERNNFKYDVLFIGSYEYDRFKTLNFLAENGIKIDVFGNMWEKCKHKIHPNLKVHYKALVGEDYVEAIFYSKITLGFLRKINNDTQTSRSFEIPACGGFMLMERTKTHLRLFKEGKEAEFFENKEELLDKLKFYLINDKKREEIAKNGRKKVEQSGYFFENRVKTMVDIIKGYKCKK